MRWEKESLRQWKTRKEGWDKSNGKRYTKSTMGTIHKNKSLTLFDENAHYF